MSLKAKLPIYRLKKSELVWLGSHLCKAHSVNFLSHYNCFLRECPEDSPMKEKIGVFDIETTGLKANWSHMLCWSMKELGKEGIHSHLITRSAVRDKNDKKVVLSAIAEITKYDRIITYYGSGFDIPYLRSRAIYHQIDFPTYKELLHTDLYYIARSKLRLHSNRLGSICQFFGIDAKNHPMTPDLWQRAGAGEKEALDEVLTHCIEDVQSTEKVWDMLNKYYGNIKRSI